jgi:hypothetical protein
MGTGDYFMEVKWSGCEADNSSYLVTRLGMSAVITSIPTYAFMACRETVLLYFND